MTPMARSSRGSDTAPASTRSSRSGNSMRSMPVLWRRCSLSQQLDDLVIRRLIEVSIPQTDCLKGLGRFNADHSIGDAPQPRATFNGADRGSHDNGGRAQLSHRGNRRLHRRSRRHSVVDENDRALLNRRQRSTSSIQDLAPFELETLTDRYLLDGRAWNAELVDEILAEHADLAACDGPHGELGMAWNAQLPHDEHIQGDAKRAR